MKLSGNTILITGGSSGIGLELGRQFVEKGNKVIICGRSHQKLDEAKKQIPELETYPCDLSDKNQCADLANWIIREHPGLNLLINNAALVHKTDFLNTEGIMGMLEMEVETNFLAPIRLIHHLFPVLQKKDRSAIINVTTGLIYAPRVDYPFYNATKSALHSFTQILRKQTEGSKVGIIEVMFPAVKTPWHNGNPPKIAIPVKEAVDGMLTGLKKGKTEIRIAGVKLLYMASRVSPDFAFKKVNSLNDE